LKIYIFNYKNLFNIIIKINASDERTSEKLLSRVYDATQIHNLNFSKRENQNPTCLILDEIDGVFEGADGKVNKTLNLFFMFLFIYLILIDHKKSDIIV